MKIHEIILNIIVLIIVYCKASHYYHSKCTAQYIDENDFYKFKKGKRFARILRVNDMNIFRIYGNAKHDESVHQEIMEPPSLIPNFINSNGSSNTNEDSEMMEYIMLTIEAWNQIFLTMFELYNSYTDDNNITDNQWKCMMWNDIWYKYLEILISDISEIIQNPSYSMMDIQPIFYEYMNHSINDFSTFLEIIQNEWELKLQREDQNPEAREPEIEVSESENNTAEINE
ncbi:Plasmodium exported protein, unknown function [Plasmodium vinckei vinckei]|uniref:Plasmodium RESA N-terminal domain-containing protein n=1 Tax=Plasmodium vinckei vinckei TaxID=54757 RepID=A0A081IAM4_PLAVN|nr:Plasmodium exported protein, unknown function [Plasmodium vinckei vinckei]KEG00732.1 hypothetical protein YYE_04563 [Plasmodium vinckei vinckei]VEV54575.1 Plasmodium exported protein, unknown function [Plasmodium vinckei vinckei]